MAHPLLPAEFTASPEYLRIPLIVPEEPLQSDCAVEELAVHPGEPAVTLDLIKSPIYLELGKNLLMLDAKGSARGYSVRNMDETAGGIVLASDDLDPTDDGWGKIVGRGVPQLGLDRTASREHISIRLVRNDLVIQDEDSTNGTVVHTIDEPRTDWTRTFNTAR